MVNINLMSTAGDNNISWNLVVGCLILVLFEPTFRNTLLFFFDKSYYSLIVS